MKIRAWIGILRPLWAESQRRDFGNLACIILKNTDRVGFLVNIRFGKLNCY